MSQESMSDRLSIDMTLVLVSVAFKLTAAGEIPKVPYLTWLDKYLLVSFIFLAFITCEHVVAASEYFKARDECDTITHECEGFVVKVLAGIWMIINIAFLGIGWYFHCVNSKHTEVVDKSFGGSRNGSDPLQPGRNDAAGKTGSFATYGDLLSVQQK